MRKENMYSNWRKEYKVESFLSHLLRDGGSTTLKRLPIQGIIFYGQSKQTKFNHMETIFSCHRSNLTRNSYHPKKRKWKNHMKETKVPKARSINIWNKIYFHTEVIYIYGSNFLFITNLYQYVLHSLLEKWTLKSLLIPNNEILRLKVQICYDMTELEKKWAYLEPDGNMGRFGAVWRRRTLVLQWPKEPKWKKRWNDNDATLSCDSCMYIWGT